MAKLLLLRAVCRARGRRTRLFLRLPPCARLPYPWDWCEVPTPVAVLTHRTGVFSRQSVGAPPAAALGVPRAGRGGPGGAGVATAAGPGPVAPAGGAPGRGACFGGGGAPSAARSGRGGLAAWSLAHRPWGGSAGEPREVLSFPR